MNGATTQTTANHPATAGRKIRLKFCGVQYGIGSGLSFPLWNLMEPFCADSNSDFTYPVGSTLSDNSLRRLGLFVPDHTDMAPGALYQP